MSVSDLDLRREVHALRDRNAKLEQAIRDMLEAPYRGMSAWGISLGCAIVDHPNRPASDRCYCKRTKVVT